MAGSPFAVAIAVAFLLGSGLLALGEEVSVWLVNGVRPLAREDLRLLAKACELWLKPEDAVLFSELAEPMPRRISPESDGCVSSESGERY